MRVAVYPGSFNPLTVAHLAIAEAAWSQAAVDRVDLVVSRVPLAKEDVDRPLLEDRVAVLREAAAARPWLGVRVTDDQLLADIAHRAALLVLGADKWAQILDPRFYGGSASARDAALARLPRVAVVPRPGYAVPEDALVLWVATAVAEVSSTAARAGRHEWLAPEAAAFDAATGAWSDPERYERAIADRHR
jgi:nicotinic acid mononucleotide adenylyltransferase